MASNESINIFNDPPFSKVTPSEFFFFFFRLCVTTDCVKIYTSTLILPCVLCEISRSQQRRREEYKRRAFLKQMSEIELTAWVLRVY